MCFPERRGRVLLRCLLPPPSKLLLLLLLLLHSCAPGPSRITPDMIISLARAPGALKDALARAKGLTFTFCRRTGLRLKWAIGNNLNWEDQVQSAGSVSFNLLVGIRKVHNWFKGR